MKWFAKLLILQIIITSFFTLNNCKPEDEGKMYGPYTLGEGKDYLNFKPGSWWVYQNSKSGLYDTLILKNINIRTETFVGKNTIIKELINFVIYSTTTKYTYKYYSSGANPDVNLKSLAEQDFISIIHGKSKPGDFQGETVSFYYPFDSSRIAGLVEESKYIGFDTTLVLKGNIFKDIRIFKQKYDACFNNKSVRYYWSKNIGLIKKEIIDLNESWDLVNFHIERP